MKKPLTFTALFLYFACFCAFSKPHNTPSSAPAPAPQGYVTPFKIFDNIYYVGDQWVSSYAVSTEAGIVLIDTLDLPYSKWIPKNLELVGLDIKDVSHILITHGHSDHIGGAGYLQELSGAKVITTAADWQLAAQQQQKLTGTKNAFTLPINPMLITHNQSLVIGNTPFGLHITPGHTKGCLSIILPAKDKNKTYQALVYGGMGTNFNGLAQTHDYLSSIAHIKKIHNKSPIAVNLPNHPHMGQLFEKQLATNPPSTYINAVKVSDFLALLEERGRLKLIEETQKQGQVIAPASQHPHN